VQDAITHGFSRRNAERPWTAEDVSEALQYLIDMVWSTEPEREISI
jgi:hypothetical protein